MPRQSSKWPLAVISARDKQADLSNNVGSRQVNRLFIRSAVAASPPAPSAYFRPSEKYHCELASHALGAERRLIGTDCTLRSRVSNVVHGYLVGIRSTWDGESTGCQAFLIVKFQSASNLLFC